MADLQDSIRRQELIQLGIAYVAATKPNTPSQVRRVLSQKFRVEVFEPEIEAEASVMAGECLRKLARARP